MNNKQLIVLGLVFTGMQSAYYIVGAYRYDKRRVFVVDNEWHKFNLKYK